MGSTDDARKLVRRRKTCSSILISRPRSGTHRVWPVLLCTLRAWLHSVLRLQSLPIQRDQCLATVKAFWLLPPRCNPALVCICSVFWVSVRKLQDYVPGLCAAQLATAGF